MNFSIFTHSKYTFEGKREHENVEIFLYSHWIVVVLKTITYGLLSIVPLIALLFFSTYLSDKGWLSLGFFVLVAYWMIIWSLYFYEIMIYLLDTWIVTNERVLDIVQKGFFYRTVADVDLARVQDISIKTHGFIQTLLDYGDVEIQSAGALNKFKFSQVPHPELVKDRIMKLVTEARAKHGEPEL